MIEKTPSSFALEAAKERLLAHLDRSENRRRLPLVATFVDPLERRVVVGLAEEPTASQRRMLEELLPGVPLHVARATARKHDGGAGNLRLRPVQGGLRITDAVDQEVGTLGVVVYSQIGQIGFLTAGHVADDPAARVGQPGSGAGDLVGSVIANGLLNAPFNIDVAFVALDAEGLGSVYTVWQQGGSFQIDTLTPVPTVGQACTLQGADSGTENGLVRAVNAEVRTDPNLPPLVKVSLATYRAQGGDSGGPVFRRANGRSELLGIHSGEVTIEGLGTFSVFTQVDGAMRVVTFQPPG